MRAAVERHPEVISASTVTGEVDLLERPVPESTAKRDRNGLSVAVPGHGIASVLVKLQAPRARRKKNG